MNNIDAVLLLGALVLAGGSKKKRTAGEAPDVGVDTPKVEEPEKCLEPFPSPNIGEVVFGGIIEWPFETTLPEGPDDWDLESVMEFSPEERAAVLKAHTAMAEGKLRSAIPGMETLAAVRAALPPNMKDLPAIEFGAVHLWHSLSLFRSNGTFTGAWPCTSDEEDDVARLGAWLGVTTSGKGLYSDDDNVNA